MGTFVLNCFENSPIKYERRKINHGAKMVRNTSNKPTVKLMFYSFTFGKRSQLPSL